VVASERSAAEQNNSDAPPLPTAGFLFASMTSRDLPVNESREELPQPRARSAISPPDLFYWQFSSRDQMEGLPPASVDLFRDWIDAPKEVVSEIIALHYIRHLLGSFGATKKPRVIADGGLCFGLRLRWDA
jgi:hypothetical protein